MLWSRLSGPFRQPAALRERAHGDGMEVGFDSPEAFEEILWRTFWPEKYTPNGIVLWNSADGHADARAFFVDHMKKIITLRRPGRLADGRYVSKNNANVARLDFIGRMFPGAKVLVPVRHPIDHARSMLRQHRNFLDMHQSTPFVRRYMADLGHYEFGDVHRPIAFPGLEALTGGRDPLDIDYWVGYWIAAFEHVLEHRDRVIVVSYEHACADPERALTAVCQRLEVDLEDVLPDAAALFRDVPPAGQGGIAVDPQLRRRAELLHGALVGERVH
jgi:hypothetical protein